MYNITVVNIKGLPKSSYHYIGRGTVLGNPYLIGKHGNRTEVISLYKQLLWSQIKAQGPMSKAIMSLAGSSQDIVLGCHCKPLACHGDVVKAAILWVRSVGLPW